MKLFQRGISFTLGLGAVIGIGVSIPAPAIAFPLDQLILRGIQLLQLSNLSTQQKVELGQDIHQQVRRNYQLETGSDINAYVNRIGQRLASASDCSQIPFRFYVVQSPQINAFSTTGGYVYINTGLIQAADNEDQVAGVLGHEIGHICNDDLIERLRETTLAQGVASAVGVDRNTIVSLGYKLAVALPNNRQDEFDADTEALQYQRRAGYNPEALPAFLTKLLKYPSPPTFLSDHPATRDRIQALQRQIAANQSRN